MSRRRASSLLRMQHGRAVAASVPYVGRLGSRERVALAAMLLAVGAAQAADAITFARLMVDHGPAAEANPLVAAGVGVLGVLPLLAAKAALVVFVVALFAVVTRTHARVGSAVATIAMVAGLVGAFANVAAL